MKKSTKIRIIGGLIFAAVAIPIVASTFAASPVTVDVNFSQLAQQPNWYPYEKNHIRIQRNNGASDAALLEAIHTQHERSFVRFDKWKPTASANLVTEHNRYGLGDSWLEDMNQRGVAPWITSEVDSWKKGEQSWFMNPPFSATEYNQFEDLTYDVVKYIKRKSPQTQIVEMFNEPNCACVSRANPLKVNEMVELYRRNANVVNRLNRELGLPKSGNPALISGGPSFISVGLTKDSDRDGIVDIEEWLDGVYASPNFNQIKPAFVSFHQFGSSSNLANRETNVRKLRNIMDKAKYNGAWREVPIWITAYSPTSGDIKKADGPSLALGAAGFAATHYYYQNTGVENTAMFAQSNYRIYGNSVLLPEAQAVDPAISYYNASTQQRTPLYNYFDMLSRIRGKRVNVASSGTYSLNNNGMYFGTDAVKGNNKAWLLSWNYNYPQAAPAVDVTYNLRGLASAGIQDNEAAQVKIWVIDNNTSNIGHNPSKDDLEMVDSFTLGAGANRSFKYSVEKGYSVLLVEIVGLYEASGGESSDVAEPTSPEGGSNLVTPDPIEPTPIASTDNPSTDIAISIVSPQSNQDVSGVVQFKARAESDGSPINRVVLNANGKYIGRADNIGNNTYVFEYDSNLLEDGANTVWMVAIADDESRKAQSVVVNVSNDSVAISNGCTPLDVSAPNGNLVPNFSMEVEGSYYNQGSTSQTTYSWPIGVAWDGNCSAAITSTNSTGSRLSQRYYGKINQIGVSPSKRYKLAGWMKTENLNKNAEIAINFWSGPNGSDYNGGTVRLISASGTNIWKQFSKDGIKPPSGSQYARVELRLEGSGTVWFDDVTLVEQ